MRMAVADLDGTLLRSDRTISDRTRSAIERFRRSGATFAVATARPPRCVLDCVPLDFDSLYWICYNGAEIYHGRELVFRQSICATDTAAVIKQFLLTYPGIRISLEIENCLYANFDIHEMKGWMPPYHPFNPDLFQFRPAAKILVDLSKLSDVEPIAAMLPDELAMVVTDGGTLGQISHIDATKMNGIRRIAELCGIHLSDIAAFGDDFNDIGMIRGCGMGVAMGNAPDAVKCAADLVTLTNDEDGVAAVLEKYCCQGGNGSAL